MPSQQSLFHLVQYLYVFFMKQIHNEVKFTLMIKKMFCNKVLKVLKEQS